MNSLRERIYLYLDAMLMVLGLAEVDSGALSAVEGGRSGRYHDSTDKSC